MIELTHLVDAAKRGNEAAAVRGGGGEGLLAWANDIGICPLDWAHFLRVQVDQGLKFAPPAARAHLVHGLHHTDVGEQLNLTLTAMMAMAFQSGWIAATLHADIQAEPAVEGGTGA